MIKVILTQVTIIGMMESHQKKRLMKKLERLMIVLWRMIPTMMIPTMMIPTKIN